MRGSSEYARIGTPTGGQRGRARRARAGRRRDGDAKRGSRRGAARPQTRQRRIRARSRTASLKSTSDAPRWSGCARKGSTPTRPSRCGPSARASRTCSRRTTRPALEAGEHPRAALPHRRTADLPPRPRQDGVPGRARPVGLDPGGRARRCARARRPTTASSSLDIGDIVGIEGCVYVTQRGQLALAVSECTLLTKTLRPPPDRHHGLGDTGTRYRYRELDLIANDETRELFVTRHKIVSAIREWLNERNFVEVETPALQSLAGGAGSRPFTTHHNALDRDLYLRISVELFLNRCIVGGHGERLRHGQGVPQRGHLPEAQPRVHDHRVHDGLRRLQRRGHRHRRDVPRRRPAGARAAPSIKRNGEEIDLAKPWRRITMREADPGARPAWTSWSPHRDAARRGARRAGRPRGDAGRRSSPDIYSKQIEHDDQPAHARLRLSPRAVSDHQAPLRCTPSSPSTSTR